jgi:hypothetical protein
MRDLRRFIHLDVVTSRWQQEELRGGKDLMEIFCEIGIQVGVTRPEDDPHGTVERNKFGDSL